jgi:hypothetical protein
MAQVTHYFVTCRPVRTVGGQEEIVFDNELDVAKRKGSEVNLRFGRIRFDDERLVVPTTAPDASWHGKPVANGTLVQQLNHTRLWLKQLQADDALLPSSVRFRPNYPNPAGFQVEVFPDLKPAARRGTNPHHEGLPNYQLELKELQNLTDTGIDDLRMDWIEQQMATKTGSTRFFLELYRHLYDRHETTGEPFDNDVLLFVHGFACGPYDFYSNLLKLHYNYCRSDAWPEAGPQHQRRRALVHFIWPTNGSLFALDADIEAGRPVLNRAYRDDQKDAFLAGIALSRFYQRLMHFFSQAVASPVLPPAIALKQAKLPACGGKIHLMAHSMGNQVVKHMMEVVRQDDHLRMFKFLTEILLVAADEDYRALEEDKPMADIPLLGHRVHLYVHTADVALDISQWTKNFRKRLGEHGPRTMDGLPSNISVVDASEVPNDGASTKYKLLNHWYHTDASKVVEDIRQMLAGKPSEDLLGKSRSYAPHKRHYKIVV